MNSTVQSHHTGYPNENPPKYQKNLNCMQMNFDPHSGEYAASQYDGDGSYSQYASYENAESYDPNSYDKSYFYTDAVESDEVEQAEDTAAMQYFGDWEFLGGEYSPWASHSAPQLCGVTSLAYDCMNEVLWAGGACGKSSALLLHSSYNTVSEDHLFGLYSYFSLAVSSQKDSIVAAKQKGTALSSSQSSLKVLGLLPTSHGATLALTQKTCSTRSVGGLEVGKISYGGSALARNACGVVALDTSKNMLNAAALEDGSFSCLPKTPLTAVRGGNIYQILLGTSAYCGIMYDLNTLRPIMTMPTESARTVTCMDTVDRLHFLGGSDGFVRLYDPRVSGQGRASGIAKYQLKSVDCRYGSGFVSDLCVNDDCTTVYTCGIIPKSGTGGSHGTAVASFISYSMCLH